MNRKHYLGYMQNIESFTARGEIQIKKNKLSNFQCFFLWLG